MIAFPYKREIDGKTRRNETFREDLHENSK